MKRVTAVTIEISDLVKDLRDKIQSYGPVYNRKMRPTDEEFLIRRAYTLLTAIEIEEYENRQELINLERRNEKLEDEVEDLRWRLSERGEKTYA